MEEGNQLAVLGHILGKDLLWLKGVIAVETVGSNEKKMIRERL